MKKTILITVCNFLFFSLLILLIFHLLSFSSIFNSIARGGKCEFKKEKSVVQLESYLNLTSPGNVPKNAEDLMQKYVAQHGPVSIGINANMMQVRKSRKILLNFKKFDD